MATDVTVRPTSDYDDGNFKNESANNTNLYQSIDDTSPDDNATYIFGGSTTGYWGFSNPSIPSGATVNYVRVYFRLAGAGAGGCTSKAGIKVNGSAYWGDPQNDSNWTTRYKEWATNPNTGSAWTVDDVNGSGAHPIQYLAINNAQGSVYDGKTFITYDASVTQLYLVVNYTEASGVAVNIGCPGKIAGPSAWGYIL